MSVELTHGEGLAHRSVNEFEVTAQSVANVAPSAVIAFGPAAMAGVAGYGAWLSWVIASIGIFAIAYCITIFARRRASVGSLYALARLTLGPSASFLTGWALIVGVIAIASGSLAGAGYFASEALGSIGVSGLGSPGWQVVLDILFLLVGLQLTITSVRRAAMVAAILEIISLVFIVIICVAVFIHTGRIFDSNQLTLKGVTTHGIVEAIVIAVLGFVGFESAAALGEEAKDPTRAVPRAIWRGAILAAVVYTFATYTQVIGFTSPAALAASASPMGQLASNVGLGFLHGFTDIGFTSSFFAVVVACMTVGARVLFGMSREGIAPKFLGYAHPKHRTPSKALILVVPFVAIPCLILVANGNAPLDVTTWIDEVGVYGYMLSYVLICIAAPLFVRRLNPRALKIAIPSAVLGVVVMGYTFFKQIVPKPAFPLDILPYVFLGGLMVGLIGYAYVYLTNPEAAKRAGTYADDVDPTDEAVAV
jgi:amino acid transporter